MPTDPIWLKKPKQSLSKEPALRNGPRLPFCMVLVLLGLCTDLHLTWFMRVIIRSICPPGVVKKVQRTRGTGRLDFWDRKWLTGACWSVLLKMQPLGKAYIPGSLIMSEDGQGRLKCSSGHLQEMHYLGQAWAFHLTGDMLLISSLCPGRICANCFTVLQDLVFILWSRQASSMSQTSGLNSTGLFDPMNVGDAGRDWLRKLKGWGDTNVKVMFVGQPGLILWSNTSGNLVQQVKCRAKIGRR